MRFVQGVRDAMVEDGPEALVEDSFKDVAARGVFFEDNVDGVGPGCFTAGCSSGCGYVDAGWELW